MSKVSDVVRKLKSTNNQIQKNRARIEELRNRNRVLRDTSKDLRERLRTPKVTDQNTNLCFCS